jgi:hypothetical protein
MRRYLRISLRAMLLGMLLFGVVLGVVVHRAERQRAAVASINRLGGTVYYEEVARHGGPLDSKPADGASLVEKLADLLGKDYFYGVERFSAFPEAAEKCLPHLRNLHGLRRVTINTDNGMLESELKLAEDVQQRVHRMLPDCEVEQDMVYLCIPLD